MSIACVAEYANVLQCVRRLTCSSWASLWIGRLTSNEELEQTKPAILSVCAGFAAQLRCSPLPPVLHKNVDTGHPVPR